MNHPDMQTEVIRIGYDFPTGRGVVEMAPGCCVDMYGCINFFLRIDRNVQSIRTYAGGVEDTVYLHDDKFGWQAYA